MEGNKRCSLAPVGLWKKADSVIYFDDFEFKSG
jgi:hypothetical protein